MQNVEDVPIPNQAPDEVAGNTLALGRLAEIAEGLGEGSITISFCRQLHPLPQSFGWKQRTGHAVQQEEGADFQELQGFTGSTEPTPPAHMKLRPKTPPVTARVSTAITRLLSGMPSFANCIVRRYRTHIAVVVGNNLPGSQHEVIADGRMGVGIVSRRRRVGLGQTIQQANAVSSSLLIQIHTGQCPQRQRSRVKSESRSQPLPTEAKGCGTAKGVSYSAPGIG
jgi:hypothetical protein